MWRKSLKRLGETRTHIFKAGNDDQPAESAIVNFTNNFSADQ